MTRDLFALPERMEISVEREDGTAKMTMTEHYQDREVVERTFKVVEPAMKERGHRAELLPDGKGITIHVTGPTSAIGDMLMGEFLQWSSIGEMRLRDIIMGGWVMARLKREEDE